MQTFLPYADVELSAIALDSKRLRKQKEEAKQILYILTGNQSSGYDSHPAVRMWQGHERALIEYIFAICTECEHRGFKGDDLIQTIKYKFSHLMDEPIIYPKWFGEESFHKSHRSNLLRKEPGWYRNLGWIDRDDFPYYWPRQ